MPAFEFSFEILTETNLSTSLGGQYNTGMHSRYPLLASSWINTFWKMYIWHYLQSDLSPCQEWAMRIKSRPASILAEVRLKNNTIYTGTWHSVLCSFILKVVTMYIVHQLTINILLQYSTSNAYYIDAGSQNVICDNLKHSVYTVVMCLWQDLMSCVAVHSSGCVWPHHISTCSAPDMTWTWHVCSSACRVLSDYCISVCSQIV